MKRVNKKKSLFLLTFVALTALLATSQRAEASPMLSLRYKFDAGAFTTVADEGAGDLFAGLPGQIALIGGNAVFDINLEVGQGAPPLPPATLALTSIVTLVEGGSGTLTVELSQTDLAPSFPSWASEWSSVFTGSGLSVDYSVFVDDGNTLFADTTLLGSLSSSSDAVKAFYSDPVSVAVPYSMTQRLVFTATEATANTGYTGDAIVTPVPEPRTMLTLSLGLLFLTAGFGLKYRESQSRDRSEALSLDGGSDA